MDALYGLLFVACPLAGLLYLVLHHSPSSYQLAAGVEGDRRSRQQPGFSLSADHLTRNSPPAASSSLPPDPGLGSLVLASLLDHVPERPEALPVGEAVHTGAGLPPASHRKRKPWPLVPAGAVPPAPPPVVIAGELVPIAPELRRQTHEDPPTPTGMDLTGLRLFCADLPPDQMTDFRDRLRESDAELLFVQALDRPRDPHQIPAGLIDPEIES